MSNLHMHVGIDLSFPQKMYSLSLNTGSGHCGTPKGFMLSTASGANAFWSSCARNHMKSRYNKLENNWCLKGMFFAS